MPVTVDRIFITRVPQTLTRDDLTTYFEQYGTLTDVYVPAVPGAAQHKGIAYVSFLDPESVKVCLSHPNGEHYINGESITVEECISKGKDGKGKGKDKGKQAGNGFSPYSQGGNLTYESLGLAPHVVQQLENAIHQRIIEAEDTAYQEGFAAGVKHAEASMPRPSSKFGNVAASTPPLGGKGGKGPPTYAASTPSPAVGSERLFITKIPGDVTQDEVYSHFSRYGSLTDLFMPSGSFQGGHKGIAFISYADADSVIQAIQHAPHELRGQQLVVDIAVPRGGEEKGKGKGPFTSAVNQFTPVVKEEASEIKPGRIFLTKVDQYITREDLTSYFGQYGNLDDVFVPSGGKQIAYVSFSDERAANACIAEGQHEVKTGSVVNAEACIARPDKGGGKGKDFKGKGKYSPY